jgi:hypothetical protein
MYAATPIVARATRAVVGIRPTAGRQRDVHNGSAVGGTQSFSLLHVSCGHGRPVLRRQGCVLTAAGETFPHRWCYSWRGGAAEDKEHRHARRAQGNRVPRPLLRGSRPFGDVLRCANGSATWSKGLAGCSARDPRPTRLVASRTGRGGARLMNGLQGSSRHELRLYFGPPAARRLWLVSL